METPSLFEFVVVGAMLLAILWGMLSLVKWLVREGESRAARDAVRIAEGKPRETLLDDIKATYSAAAADPLSRSILVGAVVWLLTAVWTGARGASSDEAVANGFGGYLVVLALAGTWAAAQWSFRRLRPVPAVGGRSAASRIDAPRSSQRDNMPTLNPLPLLASAVMLLLAAFDDWPRGFYQMLRVVVCGSAVYVAVQWNDHRWSWPWAMGAIGVLFNPVIPITFSQQQWQPIDFGIAMVFLIAVGQEAVSRARRAG
ncbi:MAG: DUF6804 family protein [Vicinamibacterales bacterium]